MEVDDTPDPATDDPFPRSFGDYELLGEIGRGGMGLVFKARQSNPNRLVALKVLLLGRYADEISRRRFRFEAEAAARLQHPNIVTVHEVGEFEGQPYFTMDLVDGPNLAELCEARSLPARDAARIVRDVAAAIVSAHAHGVLHRDLKPSNVLFGSDGRPRVTDFGMAKLTDDSRDLTAPGQLVGSPNYSSPEQASSDSAALSTASDVYGIGALLYHLLTRRPPFSAATPAATLRLVLETEATSPRLLDPAIPRDLETVCLKCMEKSPERRYSSAREIVEELDLYLADEPIRARRVSRLEASWRWCRRRPAISALSLLAVLLLAGTAVVSTLAARRIGRAQREEHAARLAAEESLYASDMQVIGAGFDAALGSSPRDNLRRLLPWRPKAGERDLRGFEWRYFWTRNRGEALGAFRGHHHVVDAVLLSPDGMRVATHSLDGALKIWDREQREELKTIDGAAALGGFTADGRRLIFSRRDGEIARLDLASGDVTRVHAATGRLIAVQPDGLRAVVFGANHLPALREMDDFGAPEQGLDVPPDTVGVMARDGQRAAVAGRPYPGIVVVNLATGEIVATLPEQRPIIALAISPDGKRLVAGGFDAVLNVWDVDRGVVERSFTPFLDPMWGLAFSPDGKMFAAGGHNRAIKVWDTSTWQVLETLTGHESTIVSLAFSSDGQRLISGAEDELAMVWPLREVRPPDELRRALRGPTYIDRTPGLAFSPDGKLMVGTAADRSVKVWRTNSFECVAAFPGEVRNVAFSADGQFVLGEAYDGGVFRWSLADSTRMADSLVRPSVPVRNWAFDPLTAQQRMAVFAEQQALRVPCTLCEISSFRDGITAGAPATASTLAVTPDGMTLFVGLPNGGVEAWDIATRKQRFVFAAHKVPVTALAVSPDGRFLATGSLDNSTGLWEVATGHAVARFYEHNRPVWALAFSPDGRTLAAGSCDKAIMLFSVGLRRCVASLPLYTGLPMGYEQEIRLLRFSPDGTALAAALGDGTIRFFRAAPFRETDRVEIGNHPRPISKSSVVASPRRADVVIDWNVAMTHCHESQPPPGLPPLELRAYAMAHIAMFNAIARALAQQASGEAAATQAAHNVLSKLAPEGAKDFAALLAQHLAAIADGEQKLAGVRIGAAVANEILLARAGDGFLTAEGPYKPGIKAGEYRFTPPFDGPPFNGYVTFPRLGHAIPFVLESANQFRVPPPYSVHDAAYVTDFSEVRRLGSKASTARTDEQTAIARFWFETSAFAWNRIARALAANRTASLLDHARLFATLNVAMADAIVAGFESKYTYNFWRPITAIRATAHDDNELTTSDPSWEPLMITPPMPDYPSTHASIGAAASVVLIWFFHGDEHTFTIPSTMNTEFSSLKPRTFERISAAAAENADSRVLVGIHFRRATIVGLEQGRAVGTWVVQHAPYAEGR